ncbi:MAG: lipid A deacylase LpxR family protein [Limisphaerales bacterium]
MPPSRHGFAVRARGKLGRRAARVVVLMTLSLAATAEPLPGDSPADPACAELPELRQWSLAARWENDLFGNTDRYYTEGASLTLLHTGAGWLGRVADAWPWGAGRRCVGYDLWQIMITSGDKLMPIPDPEDRPYAGILYAGLALHVDQGKRYHGLKFITGVAGPWALAGEAQREVHRWIQTDLPQGWDYQLHNEPLFNLIYEHRRKYRMAGETSGFAVEALPAVNVMLGNLLTQGQIGGQIRFGFNLPDDFGSSLMRGMGHLPPPRPAADPHRQPPLGVYFFGGLQGNLVLHNLTLDGNTWKDSPSVDRELLVPAAEVGLSLASRRFTMTFSYVFFGDEFQGQRLNSEFGACTVTYRF